MKLWINILLEQNCNKITSSPQAYEKEVFHEVVTTVQLIKISIFMLLDLSTDQFLIELS